MAPDLSALLAVIDTLLGPSGCPWDQKQTPHTLAEYLLEEACELVDAIRSGDVAACAEEWGDTLFILLFIGRLLERELPDFLAHATREAEAKMIRRHPHVFGEGVVENAAAQRRAWEEVKAAERAERAGDPSLLADLPLALPALSRAEKLQRRAARIGFDWPEPAPVLAKIREELDELEATLEAGEVAQRRAEELGDLLFAIVNLARKLEVDAEEALRAANAKFERRFRAVEARARAAGGARERLDLAALDALWEAVKREEASNPPKAGP